MKQQVYINILARQSGVDYSALINFETILVNMDEAKALTKNNQLGKINQKQGRRCRCGSIKHLQIPSNDLTVGLSYRKDKK